jgi:hypothetical protein
MMVLQADPHWSFEEKCRRGLFDFAGKPVAGADGIL